MKAVQLSEHIGNIDEELVEQAAQIPNYGHIRRKRRIRRFAAAAAAAVLMAGSFSAGALAFAREVVVEVPARQESLELADIGLTLLLPDVWSGKYGLEKDGDNYIVYNKQIREALSEGEDDPFGGVLFYIICYAQAMTPEQVVENGFDYTAYRYLFATKERTYILYHASDVQWDPGEKQQEKIYRQMESEVEDIRFVVDGVLSDG